MIPQLSDENLIANFLVNDSVLGSDPSRPETLERMLERLRFANAAVRISHDIFDQFMNARDHLRVVPLPV